MFVAAVTQLVRGVGGRNGWPRSGVGRSALRPACPGRADLGGEDLSGAGRYQAPSATRTQRRLSSVVYHVENGVITQYWIQIDRAGLTEQLARPSDE